MVSVPKTKNPSVKHLFLKFIPVSTYHLWRQTRRPGPSVWGWDCWAGWRWQTPGWQSASQWSGGHVTTGRHPTEQSLGTWNKARDFLKKWLQRLTRWMESLKNSKIKPIKDKQKRLKKWLLKFLNFKFLLSSIKFMYIKPISNNPTGRTSF